MTVENGAAAVEAPAAEGAPDVTPTVETPAEVVVEAPKEEPKRDPASAKFAALARREKEVQAANQRAKQAEADLARRQAEIDARAKEIEERDKAARSGRPLDRLKAMGLSPEDVNRDLLGGYTPPEEDPVDAKLSPLQKQLQEVLKQNEELRQKVEGVDLAARQRKQQEDYLKFVDAVKKTVADGGDKFEYIEINGQEAIDLVQETMVKYYTDNNNALLSYDEACELVEEYYEQQAEKLAKSKKLQSKFKTAPQATPTATPTTAKPKDVPATLTADMTTGSQDTVDINKMSDREAKAYLAKMLTFKK